MGRCLDFGPPPHTAGSPVFIFDCNGTIAQQVGIEELLPSVTGHPQAREVRLHAGNLCIGGKTSPADGVPLVLQPCSLSAGQIFGLDGDSVLVASDRSLVAQLKDGGTPRRTPVVLGRRELADFEFWDISATDGSTRKPTSGFVSVSQPADFVSTLSAAGPGTVIEIVPTDPPAITFPNLSAPIPIPAGVTIRGDRRGVLLGPQISQTGGNQGPPVDFPSFLEVTGPNVRITGLRIRGPSRDPDGHQPALAGILGHDESVTVVDHNDMSDWTRAAIDLYSVLGEPVTCSPPTDRPHNLRIARNFLHHNEQQIGDGYGVASGWGANPLIDGNCFLMNRHSITGDGYAFSTYSAWNNLFLKSSPTTGGDVDMHGQTGDPHDIHHDKGIGGAGAEVVGNTFFGTGRPNFASRGVPCSGAIDVFRGNVSVQDLAGAVQWTASTEMPPYLRIDSKFCVPNPTSKLGVGDFDGDGKDDLLLATGAAWYYAPAANAEWRFLSAKTDTLNSLLFGDFDGDGRTDVFTQIGDTWLVSWGGRSPWQVLSSHHQVNGGMTDLAIGDFVGDGRADVFYADGTNWYVSDGGVEPFVYYATSSYRIVDLAFGDFDGDGKTDVVGVVANQWMAVFANQVHEWRPLRPALTTTMKGLIVADFDGDGHPDIAMIQHSTGQVLWQVSRSGTGDWTSLTAIPDSRPFAAVGRFDDHPGADILVWHENFLEALSSGTGAPQRQSRQDMR
jgi:VCBS repeat protein